MERAMQKRDLSEFCDQLTEMQLRFSRLDSCERTIALYYLMVGLPFASARFLQRTLEAAVSKANTPEAQMLERNANDPLFISTFLSESPQVALTKVLAHIPLLRPGNKEAIKGYIMILRRVLSDVITPTYKIYNECVEILSYVFVHPAFGREDKKSFRQLLFSVLQPNSNYFTQSLSESSDESVSPNPEPVNFLPNCMLSNGRLNRRSNSLTPGHMSSRENVMPENWSSQESLCPTVSKPRSYSLSNDKSLPLKTSGIQTSSSETRLQDLQTQNSSVIMKGIVSWLKSLRLHKYSWVFNNLSYDQMLNLTEEDLENMGITKGARHKLLLNIAKLKERSQVLTELETEVINGGDLLNALKKLTAILQSPLQTTAGENLPTQFTKVMGKVCTQILMLRQPPDDYILMFISLCERAESSDAFTEEQRRRLELWKAEMTRGNPLPSIRAHRQQNINASSHKQQNIASHLYSSVAGPSSVPQAYAQKSSSYPNVQGGPIVGSHRHSLGSTTLQNQIYNMNSQVCVAPGGSIGRTDLQTNFGGYDRREVHTRHNEMDMLNTQGLQSTDIESSLESLCLQMMEHALGP